MDKSFTLYNRVKIVPAMDIFNLFNGNTSLSIRGTQNASNANTISSILAPRVIRFGATGDVVGTRDWGFGAGDSGFVSRVPSPVTVS